MIMPSFVPFFMDESKEKIALRLWNGPRNSDVVTTQDGKSFTLYNIPLYYAGSLQVFLDSVFANNCNSNLAL